MTKSATSHLMPVFARADLAFESGEGVWLNGTDGQLLVVYHAKPGSLQPLAEALGSLR